MKCAILNCKLSLENRKKNLISFHQFPSDPNMLKKWMLSFGKNQIHLNKYARNECMRICSVHFDDSMIDTSFKKPCLRQNAIPCRFLIKNNFVETSNQDIQTIEIPIDIQNIKMEMSLEENTAKKIEYSLQYTCRTCTKTDNQQILIPLPSIPDELQFLNIKFQSDDGLPQKICNECMDFLTNVETFQKICETSQKTLEKYFKTCIVKASTNSSSINAFDVLNQKCEDKAVVLSHESSVVNVLINNELEDDVSNKLLVKETNVDNYRNKIDENYDADINETVIYNEDDEDDDNLSNNGNIGNIIENINKDDVIDKEKIKFISRCKYCGMRFKKITFAKQHERLRKCVTVKNPSCRYCKNTFSNIDELIVHIKELHPFDRPHACTICNASFSTTRSRNNHMSGHSSEISRKCKICNKVYANKQFLAIHEKKVHTISKHICPICSKEFNNSYRYEYHLKWHNPDKKYKCKFCEKQFLQHHHLNDHERTHTGLRPYLCNICGKSFREFKSFSNHSDAHSDVKRFVCNVCGKAYRQSLTLKSHMQTHTGIFPFKCEICKKDFSQRTALTKHMRTHNTIRKYKCKICDKAFAQHRSLTEHLKRLHDVSLETHTNVTNNVRRMLYTCELCDRSFKIPTSLTLHMKLHSDDRKYECEMCGSKFKRPTHLRTHIDGVHLKKKPFKCTECDKTFARSNGRDVHMLSHTGERPHKCSYCDKGFSQEKCLRLHMRVHTDERPYECSICKLKFKFQSSFSNDDDWDTSNVKAFNFNDDEDDEINIPLKTDHKLFLDDSASEISYELPSNKIPIHLLISDSNLRIVLEEQSMEETPLQKGIAIEDEIKILRRKLKERVHAPPASIVINQMLMKKPYSLDCFKSMDEKEELLDEAIQCGNGDAILSVILYLVKTLRKKYVYQLLQTKPDAVQHYINYLLTRLQVAECSEWLILLGKHNESAILQFHIVMEMYTNANVKKDKLQKIYNEYFSKAGINSFYSQIVINYINLLDLQLKESVNNLNMMEYVDSSVLKVLYLAVNKHGINSTSSVSSSSQSSSTGTLNLWHPNKLMEMYKINQLQYEWIALNERAKTQAWRDLENLFEKKSWHNLKSKTFTINIPLDRVVLQLLHYNAPVAVLNHFLSKINDAQQRLLLARKCQAIKSIVDSLVELKDKHELENLIEQLTNGTDVRFYAENALKSLNSKWKTENLKIIK